MSSLILNKITPSRAEDIGWSVALLRHRCFSVSGRGFFIGEGEI